MWKTTRAILVDALRDFRRSWRRLVAADVAWKAFAFALLTPGTILLLRVFLSRQSDDVIADAEIAKALLTTVPGIVSLVVGGVVLAAITGLEVTGLMAIGFAGADGKTLGARQALLFAVTHAPRVLGLTAHMVVRVLAGLLPFGLGGGLVYLALLRPHDINYYLARAPAGVLGGRPPRRRPRGRASSPSSSGPSPAGPSRSRSSSSRTSRRGARSARAGGGPTGTGA